MQFIRTTDYYILSLYSTNKLVNIVKHKNIPKNVEDLGLGYGLKLIVNYTVLTFIYRNCTINCKRSPSYKESNARFTSKPLSDQWCGRYWRFSRFKSIKFWSIIYTGCPNKHGNSVTNSISSFYINLWFSIHLMRKL